MQPVLVTQRSSRLQIAASTARRTPQVLQTSVAIDFEQGLLTMSVDLTTRFGRRPAYDWLLRLDLAWSPPVHEQWHGHSACVGGHTDIQVQPKLWPTGNERWFLHLWMRDPNGNAEWDLVDTRLLT